MARVGPMEPVAAAIYTSVGSRKFFRFVATPLGRVCGRRGGKLDIKGFLWMFPAVSAFAYQAALVLMGASACQRGKPSR